MRIRSLVYWCGGLFVLVTLFPINAQAIGFSPSVTEIKNIRNTNSVERTIFVSRAQPDETEEYDVTIKGSASAFINPVTNRIVLPRGQRQVPFVFFIEPRNVDPGEYKAEVTFIKAGQSNFENTQLAVLPGSTVRVSISVTDRAVDSFNFTNISLDADPKNEGIFSIPFLLQNTGNVPALIDQVKVTVTPIISDTMDEVTEIIPVTGLLVNPLSEKNFSVKVTKVIPNGQYTFKIDFIKNSKSVHTATFSRQIGQIAANKIFAVDFGAKRQRKIVWYSALLVVTLGGLTLALKQKKSSVRSRARSRSRL